MMTIKWLEYVECSAVAALIVLAFFILSAVSRNTNYNQVVTALQDIPFFLNSCLTAVKYHSIKVLNQCAVKMANIKSLLVNPA